MEALREFAGKFVAHDVQRTMQEWISLQLLTRPKAQDQMTPVPERDSEACTEKEAQPARRGSCFSTLLYYVARKYRPLARSWNTRFPGWRGGMVGFCILGAIVLLTNVSALIWAARHLDDAPYATMITRSCKSVSNMSFWIALAINFFSTALLAGSNYCMQCLSSPTRDEVDDAHAQSYHLNIGILSWRNVKIFRKRRIFLLCVLLLSSVPLHFVYNSTVGIRKAAQLYDIAVVTPEFFSDSIYTWDCDSPRDDKYSYACRRRLLQEQVVNGQIWDRDRWENLTASECKDDFNLFRSDRGSVLLVSTADGQGAPINFSNTYTENEFKYLLSLDSVTSFALTVPPDKFWRWREQSVDEWRMPRSESYSIEYCLSLKVPHRCRLQIHVWFVLAVVVLNTIKFACMLFSFWEQHGKPLVTVGDAVNSFLRTPCEHSRGSCLWSEHSWVTQLAARMDCKGDSEKEAQIKWAEAKMRRFQALPLRYSHAVKYVRWGLYSTSCTLLIAAAAYTYNDILVKYRRDQIYQTNIRTFWKMGFGNLYQDSSNTAVPHWCELLPRLGFSRESFNNCYYEGMELYNLLLASLPQLFVSAAYVALNHHLTLMVQLRDWTRLASHRQPLRVSEPEPDSEQVSTYWLSLPYRYSIPQLVSSIVLGWLVSQALFFYRVTWYDDDGSVTTIGHSEIGFWGWDFGVGFSALGALCSIMFGLLVFLVSVALGFRKCAPGSPLGPTNSFVIAAACHPPENDRHAGRKWVQWGAVATGDGTRESPDHCTITSRNVQAPVEGRFYA